MRTYRISIDGRERVVAGCPFCDGESQLKEGAGNAFGFLCTCGGKRYVQTYFDHRLRTREERIRSAIAAWNTRPLWLATSDGKRTERKGLA